MRELDPKTLKILSDAVQEKTGWDREAAEGWVNRRWEKWQLSSIGGRERFYAALHRLDKLPPYRWEDNPIRVKLSL